MQNHKVNKNINFYLLMGFLFFESGSFFVCILNLFICISIQEIIVILLLNFFFPILLETQQSLCQFQLFFFPYLRFYSSQFYIFLCNYGSKEILLFQYQSYQHNLRYSYQTLSGKVLVLTCSWQMAQIPYQHHHLATLHLVLGSSI